MTSLWNSYLILPIHKEDSDWITSVSIKVIPTNRFNYIIKIKKNIWFDKTEIEWLWHFFHSIDPLPSDACGNKNQPLRIINSSDGEILSPNYPDQYPNDSDCQWLITVDDGNLITLTIADFDLEYR